jgi:hypothetical protein
MNAKQKAAKTEAQAASSNKERAIELFAELMGYDLAAISDMPRNWKQAIARLV